MKSSAGFVGFDGTENKRTLLALQEVKRAAGIKSDLNVLLRRPACSKSMLAKLSRICSVTASIISISCKDKREVGDERVNSPEDFFGASGFAMVDIPGEELPYVKAGLAHSCFVSLMGDADRPEHLKELAEGGKVKITDELKADFSREFFFGQENYEMFEMAKPKLVQCTSCNTTGLSRLALAARPLGLTAVLGNIDHMHGDPRTVVKASPSAIQFGKDTEHQDTDAGTVFKEVEFPIRASKVPTTIPHTTINSLAYQISQLGEPDLLAKENSTAVEDHRQNEGSTKIIDWVVAVISSNI